MNIVKTKIQSRGVICSALFLTIVGCGCIFAFKPSLSQVRNTLVHLVDGEMSVRSAISQYENIFNSIFSSEDISLDAFSLTQRLLGKHEVRNFEVLKADDGILYLQDSGWPSERETLDIVVDEYKQIYETTQQNDGDFLYVQVPYKNASQAPELLFYSQDMTENSEDYIVGKMRELGIPTLDLRSIDNCHEVYITDHHWTVKSGFYSSGAIVDALMKEFNLDFPHHECYGDINNYEAITYNDSLLGSIGVKVGPYYAGKDDFTIYNPLFNTELDFSHFINQEEQFNYSGDFWETFISQELLEDEGYYNKYGALMRGAYNESVVYNKKAENNLTCLLITHSYGRSLAQYLCMNFSELRYLDPQKGRYNDNYLEYINEYKPDVVILMYDDLLNVGDGYWNS